MRCVLTQIVMPVAMLLASLPVSAYDFKVNGIYYYVTNPLSKEVAVTYDNINTEKHYYGNIVIPSSVSYGNEQYSVTAIGKEAFRNCRRLTSITIPNSVMAIGNEAFYGCYRLTSITIPNSVTTIGDYAFYYCSSLTSITIPNSVTTIGGGAFYDCSSLTSITLSNSLKTIGDEAFAYCSSLTSITIPNSVTTIGKKAFSNCDSLTSVAIPNSVTTIGNGAFSYCTKLTSITIPNSVTAIGDGAFWNCSSLTSITIPNSVTTIGDYAFVGCSSLTSITIPNSVTAIGVRAFYDCDNLTSITIPNSVTTIGDEAFRNCSSLTSITIPNSVTAIGEGTFWNCSSLTSITIPNSVTAIGDGAFWNCDGLILIISLSTTPPECRDDTFFGVSKQNCTIFVPAGSKEAYKQARGWSEFVYIKEIALVSEILLNKTEVSIKKGSTFQLTAEILPTDATNQTLQWESSNTACVTVDADGLLTAIEQGEATITVRSADDGNAEATCHVKVVSTSDVESIGIDNNAVTEVYNLSGVKVANSTENLPKGIYIVRKGSTVRKILVR